MKLNTTTNNDIRYGYSAQQVKDVAPEFVNSSGDDLAVRYIDIHTIKISLLENKIKEQDKQIEELKTIIKNLKP